MCIVFMNQVSYSKREIHSYLGDLKPIIITKYEHKKEIADHGYEVFGVENYKDDEEIFEIIKRIDTKQKITKLISTSETDVLRAAKIRKEYDIPGQRLESATAYRDKVVMKSYLSDSEHFETPKYFAVSNKKELLDSLKILGYPAVFKPRCLTGSAGVHILRQLDDIEAIEDFVGMEVEEFIPGAMYMVDGVAIDGQIAYCWPSKVVNDNNLVFKENKHHGGAMLEEKHPLRIRFQRAAIEVIKKLPSQKNMTFHAEFFHDLNDPKNRIVLCEIACRVGGAFITESYKASYGIDLAMLPVQYELGEVSWTKRCIPSPRTLTGFIIFPLAKNLRLKKFDTVRNINSNILLIETSQTEKSFAKTSGDYAVKMLIEGKSLRDMEDQVLDICEYCYDS